MTHDSRTPSRKVPFILLCLGTVVALGCALGPVWMVRVGLAVALLTALSSVLVTWRQMDRMVREHMTELRAVQEAAREELRQVNRAHHDETMAMIERFNQRKADYRTQIADAQLELADLRAGLATAQLDAETKQTRISALNKIVSDLEKQIEATEVEAEDVLSLPRRGAGRRNLAADVASLPLVYPTEELRQA